jgi:hypothetical protein
VHSKSRSVIPALAGAHAGHAMQFLAVGHKIRIGFLRNVEQIQKNSDQILKNLDLIEEIQTKFR